MATKTFPIVSAGTLPKVLLVFLVGGFGGIAPTMLRIGVDLSQRHGSVAEINGSILLGMAIFFIMGGAVAAIWNEVDLKKVFYIGLGLPSLITVATSTATAPQATAELLPKTTSVVAMSNLRFQTVSQNGRLEILLPPEVGYSGAVVIFYGSGSPVTVPINAGSVINVPDQASEVIMTTPIAPSDRIALKNVSANSLTVLRLAAQKDPLYGLRYAVGMHSKPFRLTVAGQTTGRADILGNCLNNIV